MTPIKMSKKKNNFFLGPTKPRPDLVRRPNLFTTLEPFFITCATILKKYVSKRFTYLNYVSKYVITYVWESTTSVNSHLD